MAKVFMFKAEIPVMDALKRLEKECTASGLRMKKNGTSGSIEGMGVSALYETSGKDRIILKLLKIPFIVSWGRAEKEVISHAGEFGLSLVGKKDV